MRLISRRGLPKLSGFMGKSRVQPTLSQLSGYA
jgi:hypothetical protein